MKPKKVRKIKLTVEHIIIKRKEVERLQDNITMLMSDIAAAQVENDKLDTENKALRKVYNVVKDRDRYGAESLWLANLHYYMKKVAELDIDNDKKVG